MTHGAADEQLKIAATPYLYAGAGGLHQALDVHLPAAYSGPATVTITPAGGASAASAEFVAGQARLVGPRLADRDVTVRVVCPAGSWETATTLPPARPWTVYIAQDKHLDYGWIHPVEQVVERMNHLVDYHLDAADRTDLHWNLDLTVWVDEYLDARPSHLRERLLTALRSGRFESGALWFTPYPGVLGVEEWVATLAHSRALAERFGFRVQTAFVQEVPSLPWGLATILAQAGLPYVVKGAYALRNPHLTERDPFPLAAWEGPDGSRVLLKWDVLAKEDTWGGYAEAYHLWRSNSTAERVALIEDSVARYGAYEHYPFDAILLAGTGFDEYPQTTVVTDFIAWFNAQGWAYPKLVDATWSQFWGSIETQVRDGGAAVPVIRGDWGTSWEEWPAQLAHSNTVYRRARQTVLAAQNLSALALGLDPATHPDRSAALAAAWRSLLEFTDHNIGGITELVADDMRDRKTTYAYSAGRKGASALESALTTLAANVTRPDGEGAAVLVANPAGWRRSAGVEMMVPEARDYRVIEAATGRELPSQLETRGPWPEHYLSFVAADVPPLGYSTFTLSPLPAQAAISAELQSDLRLEDDRFRLCVDATTGGLSSLWDKTLERELVDAATGVALNQYLYWSDGTLHMPRLESATVERGPVTQRLVTEIECAGGRLRSAYLLHAGLDRVDIINDLSREATPEPQCSWFAFPFAVPDRQYHYDTPGAILRPGLQGEGGDLLAGAGRACLTAQSFLAAANDEFIALVAAPDTHLFQLGAQALSEPLADLDPRHPLALSLVMQNLTRNDHALAQGGQTHFQFRYSVTACAGPFQAARAMRFGQGVALPMPAAWMTGPGEPRLAASSGSLIGIEPDTVLMTGLAVAPDGHGRILRLWECAGRDTEAVVTLHNLGATRAWRCDLLGTRLEPLGMREGVTRLLIPANGLRALCFE